MKQINKITVWWDFDEKPLVFFERKCYDSAKETVTIPINKISWQTCRKAGTQSKASKRINRMTG